MTLPRLKCLLLDFVVLLNTSEDIKKYKVSRTPTLLIKVLQKIDNVN